MFQTKCKPLEPNASILHLEDDKWNNNPYLSQGPLCHKTPASCTVPTVSPERVILTVERIILGKELISDSTADNGGGENLRILGISPFEVTPARQDARPVSFEFPTEGIQH